MTLQDVKQTIRRRLRFAKRRLNEAFIRLTHGNNNTSTYDRHKIHLYFQNPPPDSFFYMFIREEEARYEREQANLQPLYGSMVNNQ